MAGKFRERSVGRTSTPLCQRLNVIVTRWLARKPYRPELHYMRGPGPKWNAKHQGRTDTTPHSADKHPGSGNVHLTDASGRK